MTNYLTIEEAVKFSGKSIRTIQRHCDKDYAKGEKLDLKLSEPIFSYQKSEKGGRLKLFSKEWLTKRFNLEIVEKNTSTKSNTTNKEQAQTQYSKPNTQNLDLKDKIIDILESDKQALLDDKKELQNIIKKLTESLQFEQRKVAQLETERMQIGSSIKSKKEDSDSSGLSNMSMTEWWAKKQGEVIEEDKEEVLDEELSEDQTSTSNDDDVDTNSTNELEDSQQFDNENLTNTEETKSSSSTSFASWVKSIKK